MAGRAIPAGVRYQQWRLVLLCILFSACGVALMYRVYTYQVVEYERFRDLASDEHAYRKEIVPRRGDILDRNGNPLAVSVMYQSLFAYPPNVKDPSGTAEKLALALGEPKEAILAKLQSSKSVVLLKRKMTAEVSTRIASLGLPGTIVMQEPFRGYPEGSMAPQLLGFVGKDFQGLTGLELTLDRELRGEPGLLDAERDTDGAEIAIGRRALVPPKDGADAMLTIDRYIQRMAERELAAAVKENKAFGGLIIIMDPKTGGILAAASDPTYDLTADEVFDPARQALYKSTIATDVYEPGSVMKLITMAAALEEKLVNPSTTFQDNGVAVIDGFRIRNWDLGAHGRESMTEVLINSCNIGAQWVANLLGPDKFYRYVDSFGFGKLTGVNLPGEASGMVRAPGDPLWSKVVLATNAFGQGIAVTPLQMITAVAAIANDGILPKPMMVKAFRDGDSVREVPPVQVRRVISSQTAKTLTDMMVHVVEDNSLRLSVVPGYKIAGKTGTADLPTESGYNTSVTYGSQVGFAPVEDPRFAILIRLDGPQKLFGGQTAAPVFKRVAEQLFTYMKVAPTGPVPPKPRATAAPAVQPNVQGAAGASTKPAATPAPTATVAAPPKPTTVVAPTIVATPVVPAPAPTKPVIPVKPAANAAPPPSR